MSMIDRIRALCAGPHRGSATGAELEAAARIAGWMRDLGAVDVREERFRHPSAYAVTYLLHFGLLTLASLLGCYRPDLAGVLCVLVTCSLYGELSMRFFWLGRLVPRNASANVVGRLPAAEVPSQTLILCAHHDTQKPGLIFREPLQRAARALERLPDERSSSPFLLPWAAAIAQCLFLATRALAGAWLPSWLLAVPGALFLLTSLLMAQWAASRGAVMGANDNATGVALMLEVGAELARRPLRRCEVLLLSSGCEESGGGGIRAFLDEHGAKLDRARTAFLVVDTVGSGQLRYVTDEHALSTWRSDPELLSHLDALRKTEAHAQLRPYSLGLFTDATPALARGFRAVAILAWDSEWFARNYHQRSDTLEHLDAAGLDRALSLVRDLLHRVDDHSDPPRLLPGKISTNGSEVAGHPAEALAAHRVGTDNATRKPIHSRR